MAVNLQDLINDGVFDIELGVNDPSSSGYEAGDGAMGKGLDGSRWIKTGSSDTDWEKILVSTGGAFVENFKLADATGETLANNVLGSRNGQIVKGDGSTEGGVPVGITDPTVVFDNTAGVIDQIKGDIPDSWKQGDSSLQGLVIGSSCTKIGTSSAGYGDGAFAGCSGLTGSLTIPDSVTSIGSRAFSGCSGFTGSLTIPDSVSSIEHAAFAYCDGFTGSLTIPDSVTDIGTLVFYECSGFDGSLTIPDSVTDIGNYAFSGCSGFTGSLTIPDSVTSIGSRAFSGCSGFTGDLTIPDSVTSIGSYAFGYCDGFTGSLTIPDNVPSIERGAFGYCDGFTGSLTIPDSVTTIGIAAFYGCSGFDGSLTIPDSVTDIGTLAFYGCSGITEIYIDSVNASAWTGSNALVGTTDLTHIYVTNGSGGSTDVLSSYGSAPFQGCDGGVTIAAWTSYPDPMP